MAKRKVQEELNEELVNQEELEEAGEEIVDDEPDDIPEDEEPEDQEEKPGKFKRFGKAIWKWTKRVGPIVGGYAAGIATPIVAKKWRSKPAETTGIQPIVPEVTTTTVDLVDGTSAEVTNF